VFQGRVFKKNTKKNTTRICSAKTKSGIWNFSGICSAKTKADYTIMDAFEHFLPAYMDHFTCIHGSLEDWSVIKVLKKRDCFNANNSRYLLYTRMSAAW
jgi:glutathionyl-hydroquinone reductase